MLQLVFRLRCYFDVAKSIARRIVSRTARPSKQLSAERRDFFEVALLALLASIDLTIDSPNDDLKW
jgi:hypothetical protein